MASMLLLPFDNAAADFNAAMAVRSAVWESPTISVCSETMDDGYSQERSWVEEQVERTWDAYSALDFVGWTACSAGSKGIRIGIADETPATLGLGQDLDGHRGGMTLNFTFANFSPGCQAQRERCIRFIAVHEFGHAIGLAHEQSHPNAPEWCKKHMQGTAGDWVVTDFDRESVMSYCSAQTWRGSGELTSADKFAVRVIYGPLNYHGTLTYTNPRCVPDRISFEIHGAKLVGQVKAPDRPAIPLSATAMQGAAVSVFPVEFRFENNDRVTVDIQIPHLFSGDIGGTLTSSICGEGRYSLQYSDPAS